MEINESETLELKEIAVQDIKKEVIAFANSVRIMCVAPFIRFYGS